MRLTSLHLPNFEPEATLSHAVVSGMRLGKTGHIATPPNRVRGYIFSVNPESIAFRVYFSTTLGDYVPTRCPPPLKESLTGPP
jgi:hypothetical protein